MGTTVNTTPLFDRVSAVGFEAIKTNLHTVFKVVSKNLYWLYFFFEFLFESFRYLINFLRVLAEILKELCRKFSSPGHRVGNPSLSRGIKRLKDFILLFFHQPRWIENLLFAFWARLVTPKQKLYNCA